MEWIESLVQQSNTVLASSVTHYGIAFAIAAFIHSGRVKKEIANQMSTLVSALNSLGEALRQDMKKQSQRIDFVSSEVETLTSRVESLETEH